MNICRHCKKLRAIKSRKLCSDCWLNAVIRNLYPVWGKHKTQPDQDWNGPALPPEPTRTEPGTLARQEVYAERVRSRQALHHPGDARRDEGGLPAAFLDKLNEATIFDEE